jgi:hypothetical protein
MNPYLEQEDAWQDFHQRFAPVLAELLTSQVRPAYIVKIEERLYIHELPAGQRHYVGRSDVSVAQNPSVLEPAATAGLLEAPARVRLPAVDIERHPYVEVRDRRSRQLVTVIELLSPINKRTGPDREQYIAKRAELLASSAHLVEIDLLRGGNRMPFEDLAECDYYVLVSRVEKRLDADLWPLGLRDPLPHIPIPLRSPSSDAQIDLQAVLNRIYDAAGYEDYIYESSPIPPLSAEHAAWAEQFLPKPV